MRYCPTSLDLVYWLNDSNGILVV
uniref:Uncharacterized protein n=1 Tax=Rhizophora mucronata TaxID=61149 RepID=A0A2P2NI30_RHIMU